MTKPCPFCTLPSERIIDSNDYGLTIRDGFPVSTGHTLIIPKRHIGSWFEIDAKEQLGLLDILNRAKIVLQDELSPDGYNIGINDGPASGQTVIPPLTTAAHSTGQRNTCSNTSAGVLNPSVFLGLVLSLFAISSS